MVGLRCIHGYLIIYLLFNYLKISVNSLDPNADTGEGTSNGTHLVGSAIKNDPVSQSAPATVTAEATPVSTPSTTPVTLDIDDTQSTSEFEFSKDGVFHSYDPKSGHTFSKVTQGHNVIWESKKNISGTFVRIKSDNNVKYLVVLLSNNMFKLFHQSNKNNPWSDITSQKHDVTKFKFYGENDAELTLSDYKISIVDYSFCYLFNTGVKCKKVLLGDKVVWNHTDDRKFKEIKSFSLGLTSNSFFIMNPSDEVKKLFFTVSIDINITQTNDDFDYSKSYDCHKFVPKDGYVFSKVTQGTNVIWESINNVFGTLVRTKILFDDEKYLAILLSNNLFKLFYQPDGKTWNDITDKRFDIKKLKFLGDGDDEINPATSYIITIVNYSYRYRFINGDKCKKIKYGNDVIWNHTDDPKFDSISMFYLGLLSNHFSVKNGSNGFKTLCTQISKVTLAIDKTSSTDKLYYHKTGDCHKYFSKPGYAFSKITQGSNVIWESKDNIYGTNVSFIDEPNKKYLIILLDNDTFSLFHQSNGTWTYITVGKIDVSKLKFLGESDSELNSSDYTVALVKHLFCYSLHDGVKCLKIKYADRDIWTNTDNSKFKSITMFHFDVISNDFFVRNESGELNKIVVKFVTLDIDKKASTDEFDYSNDNEFHQYVPKSRHYFTKVSEGTTVVWESKDNLVGTKVRTKFKGNEKYVAILLSNNLFKLLQQSNGRWTDITDKRHDMTKLKFYGENDKEITTSDYKVDLVSLIAYRIIFKSGVNCKKIKYGDDDLWKHTDDPDYSTITILGLGLVTNDFYVHKSDSKYKELKFKPTTKPITLDVNKPSSTDKFHYSKTGDCHKYVTRAGYSFNKVSQGNNVIWESKSDVCGTNVSFIDEIKNKYIAILLDNNTFSLFHQFHDTWTDITGEKYDVSKLKFLGESGTELTLSDYTVALVEYSLRFTFNSGVKCLKIKYADVDIWQHSDDTKFQLITMFHLDLISNSFFVKNEPGEFKKLNKPVIKGTPVTLDIDKKESTIEFNYSKSGNFHKYVPKLGHVFNKVVQGTTVIWQIQNCLDFGEKILLEDFDRGKRTLIIDTRLEKKMFCRLNEDPSWKEVDEKPQKAFETIEDSTGQGKTTEQEQETQSEETTHKKETTDDSAAEQPKEQLHVPTSYSYVTLDLNNTSSTGEFDYHKKNEFATYTPKSGYLFNKVIRSASSDFSKEEVFWNAQAGLEKYVKMVRLKLTDNHAALILTTGEFLLFHKDDVDQEWKDITTSKHNFSGFKFFTFDPESYEERELDRRSYNLELHEFSYGVTFGDEVECYLIKHNDKLIYNYEQDLEFDTLKGVYLGLVSNKFFLTNFENDNKRLDLNKAVSPPKPKPEKTSEANDQSTSTATVLQELLEEDSEALIPEAKLTSLNINVSENTSNYQCSDNGIYKTFTALPGHGFNDVKVATKTFWKSQNNDYGIKVRLKESSNHEKYVVILLASKKYQLFYSSGKRKPLVDITDAKNSFYGIKLFSKSETTSVYEQLSFSSYNVYLYHLSLGYRTKESLKFHLVKLGNDVIYNCDDDQEFGVMKGAYLDLIENNIYVINMHDQRKVVKELDRGKTVTIDLNKTETTSDYEYEKKDDLVTYTSIGSAVFDKLIRSSRLGSDEIIWKARDMKEHSKKIILDGQGKRGKITNVILHLVSDDIKHLDYLDGNWIETSNKVTLNLDCTSGTDEFEYSKDGEFTTFKTKGLYLFNSLIESSSSDSSEKIVLKTSNPKEFITRVVLKDSGNKNYLALLRVDNKFLLLHKEDSSQHWKDISNTRLNLYDLKMFYYDDDTTGYLLLKDDNYSVLLEKFSYAYEFGSDTKCHMIKFGNTVIWSHGADPKFESLKSVRLNLLKNKLCVVNHDGELNEINIPGVIRPSDIEDESKEEFEEEDSVTIDSTQPPSSDVQPEHTESTTTVVEVRPENLMELDLNNMKNTENNDYLNRNDNHVFTVKNGFKFSKVRKGEHVLKEFLKPDYSCKVVVNYGQAAKIMLYAYKNDKDFDLLLLDDPNPLPRDITELPSGAVDVQQESAVVSEHFKLFGLTDDGSSQELDATKLKKDNLVSMVNYTFEPDTKCSEIKYNNKTVWKYDKSKHGRHYPTNMLLNTATSFILLESEGHYQYYYTYINDEWRCISGYKTQDLQPLYPDKLKIFTLNAFGIPVADDTTQYDKSEDGPFTTFKFNPGSRCIDVKYEGFPVWSYNYKDHEDKYPTTISVNTDEKTVMVDCSGIYRYLFSYSAGNFKCVFAFKSRLSHPVDPSKLKFFIIDSSEITVELDKSKFDIEEPDTIYKFNPGVKCTCIKYGDTELWKHTETDHEDKFPTSISFNNLILKYLVVESSGDYRNLLEFENNVWKPLGANDKLKSQYSIYDKFDVDKLAFFTIETKETSDGTVTSELVQIDYTKYIRENPSFILYNFKPDVNCNEVRYEDQVVWKYNVDEHGDDFPTTVLLNIKKSYIVVDSSYLYRYVYSYHDKNWKELPFGFKATNIFYDKFKLLTQDPKDNKKLVEIDSSQYDIEYSPNVLAIKFNTNAKCTCIMYDKKEVWTYDRKEHAHRFPTGVIFNKPKSFLMVESSHYYRYLYLYQNKEWKPLPYGYTLKSRSSSSSTYDIGKLKLLTNDKLDNRRVEMTKAHYDKEESDTLVRYNMNYLTNCTCLMYDDKVVWEHYEREHGDKHPTTISLVKKKNYLVVESGYDYRYMFEFENGEWKLLPFSYKLKRKVDAVEIDKFKLYSSDLSDPDQLVELKTSEYEKKDSYNSLVFTIKENVKCTFVKYDNTDAWVHDSIEHEDFYPTRVVFTKNKNFLLVESGYNYRYLYTFHKGKWKQMPFGNKLKTTKDYKFDANKLKLFSLDLSTRPYELDYSKFRRGEAGHILTHNLKPGVKCTEVKYDKISAWKHEEDDYGSNYPTSIIFNRNNGFLIVESKDNYESYHSYYDNKWHSVYGYKASKMTKNKEFYRLKLYQTNEDGLSEPLKGFHEEITGPVITCNIFYGVKCTHVKYDEHDVWSYDSERHLDHYPDSVVFNIANSTIKVECEDHYVYFSSFINEEWKPFSGYRTKTTNARPEVKLYEKGKSGKFAFINPSKYNVNWDGENDVYEYDLNNLNCSLVKHNDGTVWKQAPEDNQHPKSITYNSDQKKFVLRFENEYIFCTFEENEWKKMVRRYGTQSIKSEPQKPEHGDPTSEKSDTEHNKSQPEDSESLGGSETHEDSEGSDKEQE